MFENGRYPTPLQHMSPAGLPGLFVVLFVIFGFTALFVTRDVLEVLLWVMVAVIGLVAGFQIYRAIAGRQ